MATDTSNQDRWKKCSICKSIPDLASMMYKGGEHYGDPWPSAEKELLVIGAPLFDTDTGSSHTEIKQCPKCGTYYKWDFEYEFLVGGSEDNFTLTRLADDEGARRAEEKLRLFAKITSDFEPKAKAQLSLLNKAKKPREFSEAVDFFYMSALRGYDVSMAATALARAMGRVNRMADQDTLLLRIDMALSEIKFRDRQEIEQAIAALQQADPEKKIARIQQVTKALEEKKKRY